MARPSKWDDSFLRIAKEASKLGATDADMARILGVSIRTVRSWQVSNPEFARALRVGKAAADSNVERSLYQRAIGFAHEDTDIRVVKGKVVKTEVVKHYPPDTTACIFWLKNRNRKDWRDRIDAAVGGPEEGAPIPVEQQVDPRLLSLVEQFLDQV